MWNLFFFLSSSFSSMTEFTYIFFNPNTQFIFNVRSFIYAIQFNWRMRNALVLLRRAFCFASFLLISYLVAFCIPKAISCIMATKQKQWKRLIECERARETTDIFLSALITPLIRECTTKSKRTIIPIYRLEETNEF